MFLKRISNSNVACMIAKVNWYTIYEENRKSLHNRIDYLFKFIYSRIEFNSRMRNYSYLRAKTIVQLNIGNPILDDIVENRISNFLKSIRVELDDLSPACNK